MTGMIRGLRHLLLIGRHPLPRDFMQKHGVTPASLQSLKCTDELCKAVEEIAIIALNYMDDSWVKSPTEARPAMLPAVLARAYLKRLADTGYNPFDEKNARPLSYRAWRLMIPALTGRF
jgi:phytoene/squalene synthetase